MRRKCDRLFTSKFFVRWQSHTERSNFTIFARHTLAAAVAQHATSDFWRYIRSEVTFLQRGFGDSKKLRFIRFLRLYPIYIAFYYGGGRRFGKNALICPSTLYSKFWRYIRSEIKFGAFWALSRAPAWDDLVLFCYLVDRSTSRDKRCIGVCLLDLSLYSFNNHPLLEQTLVEISFYFLLFVVTKLNFHEFIVFSRKLPCIKFSLIRFNSIKLPIRCILNLAVIPSRDVLQVSSSNKSNFKRIWDLIIFTAISKFQCKQTLVTLLVSKYF